MTRLARFTLLAATLLGAVATARPACAQAGARTVVVMPFANAAPQATELQGLRTAIAILLGDALAVHFALNVVTRAQLRQRLPAGVPGLQDRQGALRVASQVGATEVITGGFLTDSAGNVRIDARLVDVASGRVLRLDRMQGKAGDVNELVHRLAARLAATPPTSAPAAVPVSTRAAARLGDALDLADRGEHARAAELLRALLGEYPGFGAARAALGTLAPSP